MSDHSLQKSGLSRPDSCSARKRKLSAAGAGGAGHALDGELGVHGLVNGLSQYGKVKRVLDLAIGEGAMLWL
jgi:hypothetical protein